MFAENEFAALDVCIAHEEQSDVIEEVCEAKAEETEPGFGMDNV